MLEGSLSERQRQIDPRLIKKRLREARLEQDFATPKALACEVNRLRPGQKPVSARNIARWESQAGTMPKISEVAPLLVALPITLDWLVGIDMTTEDVVRTVTAKVGAEVDEITKKLTDLMNELAEARAALVRGNDAEGDIATGARFVEERAKKRVKPVAVPRKSAG